MKKRVRRNNSQLPGHMLSSEQKQHATGAFFSPRAQSQFSEQQKEMSGKASQVDESTPEKTTPEAEKKDTTAGGKVTGTATPLTATGKILAKDNFSGRSNTRYGVGEILDLSTTASSVPTGTGLEWVQVNGNGSVSNTGAGAGTYTCHDRSEAVKLELRTTGGSGTATVLDTKDFSVVEPSNALMKKAAGTNVWHVHNTASAGFKGEIYMRPTDVSFKYANMREGSAPGTGTGFYSHHNGRSHPVGSWVTIGGGNSSDGSKINGVDTVQSGTDKAPYSAGTFNWPIPWNFKVGSGTEKNFTTANHYMEADATGTVSISKKGAGPYTKAASDASSSY